MSELYLDLFEKYTKNQLTETEKSEFETKLMQDVKFKNEFDKFKILQAGIRLSVLKDKLDMIKNHASNKSTQRADVAKSKWWYYTLYISIMLGVLSLVYYVSTQEEYKSPKTNQVINLEIDNDTLQKIDSLSNDTIKYFHPKTNPKPKKNYFNRNRTQEIYASNDDNNQYTKALSLYSTPDNLAIILRDTPSKKENYTEALKFYDDQNYIEALVKLSSADDEKSNYLRAHCLLLSGQSEKAAEIFGVMAKDDFSNYYEDSKWYLAIALYANYPETKEELYQAMIQLEKTNSKKIEVFKLKSWLK